MACVFNTVPGWAFRKRRSPRKLGHRSETRRYQAEDSLAEISLNDKPTSFDIAALAGVSQPTISRAVRGEQAERFVFAFGGPIEVGIGIAWASILAMPYAILASSLPQRKLGIYMGLFNVFVVVPQLLVATVMGSIMQAFFPNEPIWTMLFAAIVMVLAALAMLRVKVEPA